MYTSPTPITISSKITAIHLVGSIDILGMAMAKLDNSLQNNPIIYMFQQFIDLQQEKQIAERMSAYLEAYKKDINMISPIIDCLRGIRDNLAEPNSLGKEPQHTSAAFQADCLEYELNGCVHNCDHKADDDAAAKDILKKYKDYLS